MSTVKHGPELVFTNDSQYEGWEDYYLKGDDGAAWGDAPPPFLADFLARHLAAGVGVVDFGAGDARNSLPLGQNGHALTLVDISAAGLDRAHRRAAALGVHPAPMLICASLEELPLASNQVTFCLCIDALPQVYRPHQALKEIARTLVPGGLLIVNVFTPADCAYGEGERLTARTFLFRNTMFHFFEDAEFRPLLEGLFTVIESQHVTWQDPPHPGFRDYLHTHDAFAYVLQKA
jgi:ubiquinone/menaquinone biosynthesis C-methylase UbiE